MIRKQQALELAQEKLDIQMSKYRGGELIIMEDKTKEEDFGWVFLYQSKRFLETGNIIYNGSRGPILIDKDTEEVIQLGSRLSSDDYIKLYKKYRGIYPRLGRRVVAIFMGIQYRSLFRQTHHIGTLRPRYSNH